MSEKGVADCAFSMRNGGKRLKNLARKYSVYKKIDFLSSYFT
jgi:hypothetical protein